MDPWQRHICRTCHSHTLGIRQELKSILCRAAVLLRHIVHNHKLVCAGHPAAQVGGQEAGQGGGGQQCGAADAGGPGGAAGDAADSAVGAGVPARAA